MQLNLDLIVKEEFREGEKINLGWIWGVNDNVLAVKYK